MLTVARSYRVIFVCAALALVIAAAAVSNMYVVSTAAGIGISHDGTTGAEDLFISEYVEGTASNKAIEIYNGTGVTVDLGAGQYFLQSYVNGSTTPTASMALTGIVVDGDVHVAADAAAATAILIHADQTWSSGVLPFNGDDAIVLRKGGVGLDVIGQIGVDPGTGWGTPPTSTADHTLTRKTFVCNGDGNGGDAFDPATEWDGQGVDTFTNLGAHTVNCGVTPTPTPTTVAFNSPGAFSWTCPAGVTIVTVETWGGGGAGGGVTNGGLFDPSAGGGGGGGAYARSTVSVVPGTMYAVSVGAGGQPSFGSGSAGQESNFASTVVVAKAGNGGGAASGNGQSGVGGLGGPAASSVGDVKFSGGRGGNGISGFSGAGGGGGASAGTASNGPNGGAPAGGPPPAGGGGGGLGATDSEPGFFGFPPGGGGGGARASNNQSHPGGSGASGRVVISYTPGQTPTPTATPTPTPTATPTATPTPTTVAFNSPGPFSWTCPPGVFTATVEAWGAGGSGGGANNGTPFAASAGGGGGGGAYARKTVSVNPGNMYPVFVGLGGPPSTGSLAGQDSHFAATVVVAKGGNGGGPGNGGGSAGAGGFGGPAASSVGDFIFPGGRGGDAVATLIGIGGGGGSSAGTAANGNNGSAPTGGGAPAGGGSGGPGSNGAGSGSFGSSPGGGGGGAVSFGSSVLGGGGAGGRIVITYTAVTTPPVVSGRVTYENAAMPVVPVPTVLLNAAGSPAVMAPTDPMGNYSLTGFGPGAYTVTPSKTPQPFTASNGIFANDAALISRHVVGIQTLSATQQKAAMVAGQPFITAQDAGFIAQYVVGIPNGINQSGQWKFTPVDRSYAAVTSNQTNQDYAATLMGDVSGDWMPTGMRAFVAERSPFAWDAVMASVPDVKAHLGEKLTIPLRLDNLMGEAVSSYQFTLEYDPAVIEPAEIAASLEGTIADGMSIALYSPVPGVLNVAVYSAFPVTGDGVYVNLRFAATDPIGRSSPVTIMNFRFNDGNDAVITTNGKVTLN